LTAALTIIARVPDDRYFSLVPSKNKRMIFSKRRNVEPHIFALQGTEITLVCQNKCLGLSLAPYIEYLFLVLFK